MLVCQDMQQKTGMVAGIRRYLPEDGFLLLHQPRYSAEGDLVGAEAQVFEALLDWPEKMVHRVLPRKSCRFLGFGPVPQWTWRLDCRAPAGLAVTGFALSREPKARGDASRSPSRCTEIQPCKTFTLIRDEPKCRSGSPASALGGAVMAGRISGEPFRRWVPPAWGSARPGN